MRLHNYRVNRLASGMLCVKPGETLGWDAAMLCAHIEIHWLSGTD